MFVYRKWLRLCLIFVCMMAGCSPLTLEAEPSSSVAKTYAIQKNGHYSQLEDVVCYVQSYGELPNNYLTKKEARQRGWLPEKGNLWDVTDQMSIGGDRFGNYEEQLPVKDNYIEADIDYQGGKRNAKRLVFNQQRTHFYYTKDHYKHFEEIEGNVCHDKDNHHDK